MAGKMYTGADTNNAAAVSESRAFCEGATYRSLGTAVAFPIEDDPHLKDSPDSVAWIAGWNKVNAAAGGAVVRGAVPNCAITTKVISA